MHHDPEETVMLEKDIYVGDISVDVPIYREDVLTAADDLEMLVFSSEDDLYDQLFEVLDKETILDGILQEAVKSPYYRDKLIMQLKDLGLL